MLALLAVFALAMTGFGGTSYIYCPAMDGATVRSGDNAIAYTADADLVRFGEPYAQALEATAAASEDQADTMRTTWVCGDGTSQEVLTHQRAGETPVHMAQRHHDKVEALKSIYPPATPQPAPNHN